MRHNTLEGFILTAGHIPVLLDEIRGYLKGKSPLVDCTTGAGGHLSALQEDLPEASEILALDRDRDILNLTKENLENLKNSKISYVHGRFSDIEKHIKNWGHQPMAILADLGVSSFQLDQTSRGFSLQRDGPLDMRMDRTQTLTAKTLLRKISEKNLREALRDEADERKATAIARRIKEASDKGQLTSTLKLARIVREVFGASSGARIDPATRSFQAIRRLVNEEGRELEFLLQKAPLCLAQGGRLAIISFHSGEDRVVKNSFSDWAKKDGYKILTPKPISASEAECRRNPRSRSGRLRVLEKAA
jgi:16S rRNA (cytosine1402-N4)-methyltransferase